MDPFRVFIPQDFEPRFRYQGDQRFVALYYAKYDSNPTLCDGLTTRTADFSAYVNLMKELGKQLVRNEENDLQPYMKERLKRTEYSGSGDVTIDEFTTYRSETLLKLDVIINAIGFNIFGNRETDKRDAAFIVDLEKRELYLSNINEEDIVEELKLLNEN